MPKLSVNINKVATLRNARGGLTPSLLRATEVIVDAGAPSITVHPRADERHIRADDVGEVHALLRDRFPDVEYNIEGDPRPGLIDRACALAPEQFTLVPVREGEITSEAGWPADTPQDALREIVARLKAVGTRVSVFVDPEPAAIDWAAALGADRVELYTEPYARAFERGEGEASFSYYARAAEHALSCGLGINAGHDLDLDNLPLFSALPGLDEVSIGHALISEALFDGLSGVVRAYIDVLNKAG